MSNYLITPIKIGKDKIHFISYIEKIYEDNSIKLKSDKSGRFKIYTKEEYKNSIIIDINNDTIDKLFKSEIKEVSRLAKQEILKLANIEYEQIN